MPEANSTANVQGAGGGGGGELRGGMHLQGRHQIMLEFLPTNAGMGGSHQKYICLGIIPELNPDMNAWLII